MSDSLSQAIEYWNRRPIEDEINWQNNNAHEVIKNLHDEIDGLNYQIKAIEDAGCLWKEGFYDEVDTWEKNRRSQEASDLDIRIQDDQP
jgi:predicted methyltransferase